jgi:hypothetical protein
MNSRLRYLLTLIFIGFAGAAAAQEILGTVTDKKKEPLVNASVQVKQGGILKGGVVTDFDGNYSVKPLEPGSYEVVISTVGYATTTIKGVVVSPKTKTEVNATLESATSELKVVEITYKKKLVDKYRDHTVLTSAEIKQKPTTQTADLVALTPGIYQSRRGAGVNSDGGRSTGNIYIIDGVQVQGTIGIDMAQGATEQLEVIASGIPANYGDVSGAVINITTKGVSQNMNGGLRLQHSIDGYNNNMASFSVSGPLLKKRFADPNRKPEPIMGFSFNADYYKDHNRYPTYNKEYVTKADVLKALQDKPLYITSDNSGQPVFNPAAAYVTKDQLTTVKQPPHNVTEEIRLNGKLDYKVAENMRIVGGGNFSYTKADQYSRGRNLFASEGTPVLNTYTGRGFLRFTQKFGKSATVADSGKHSLISNAYYTVQVDYQKLFQRNEDPKFGQNIFEYGYIGKFNKNFQDLYFPNQTDSVTGRNGTVLLFTAPTGINFTRDEKGRNPILANYTSQYYEYIGENRPFFLTQLQAKNALANGDMPASTYSMFLSPGSALTGYSFYNSDQYSLSVDAAFDLKTGSINHNIEFGLYYQQRIIKSFSVSSNLNGSTASLWQQMRQLVSSVDNGNLKLDKNNPITKINGINYTYNPVTKQYLDEAGNVSNILPSPTDTIYYKYINPAATTFDKNLRKKLGYNSTQNINVDALDPSTFTLDMFSADELLNSGNPFVSYYGYGYAGQAQTTAVNFNDFWTAKDANGNYTRPIGAFSPNYIAGYVLDKFEFKNILFNIGVRVDRYSANTKVLKDPYSLYGTQTISQTQNIAFHNSINGGKHPSNLPGDAVVYVDDNNSSNSSIVGYRQGSNWYDATGKFIQDPSILKDVTGGRDPQPLLVDKAKITDTSFNPNNSFTDYNPAVTVMPRVQVSFPISENSKFFAHYDIYAQRPYPTGLGIATAYDYYYLNQNSNTIISNANLRPEKTIDYELGFEQAIGREAVLKLNGFYKERKDMISVVPYLYAYPTTYYTYGNRDFSTTKGLKAYYEMHVKNLGLSVSYTLQFTEGTGSSPYSTNGGGGGQVSPQGLLQSFIEAGLPNLRYISVLDYDSRHNIVCNIDYRYGKDQGPVVKGKHVLQNAGVDFVVRTRSGEPFTRLANPDGRTIIGGINGSRLPWHFGVDMRVNKDFTFSIGKKPTAGPNAGIPKVQRLSAFIYINNLLNTREIMGVYGYTGKPDDNGFLSSATGQQTIPVQINPTSYQDLYKIATSGPYNLNYARTINLGVEFNF